MTQQRPNGISEHQYQGGARSSKTPAEVEAEIDRTRSAISSDLSAIGDKFAPERIRESAKGVLHDAKEEARDLAREATGAAVDSLREVKDSAVQSLRNAKDTAVEAVTDTVTELSDQARRAGSATWGFASANAVPLTLLGIGAAWLTLSLRSKRNAPDAPASSARAPRESSARPVRERLDRVAEQVGAKTAELRERAEDKLHGVGQRVSEWSDDARYQFDRAETGAREFARDNPLVIGAAAVAAGVGVGLMLPRTESENELVGEARERLMSGARDTAERVGRVAKEAAAEVRSAISEAT